MKTALVTTTINVPHVLRLYRRCDPDVRFFVTGDEKSPDGKIKRLCLDIEPAIYLTATDQRASSWKCSDLIGWNCIQRRNIATLEALRWGADIIVTVDDDNLPVNQAYFTDYQTFLDGAPFDGLLASPEVEWFDHGRFYQEPAPQRGHPHQWHQYPLRLSHVVDAKIGVHAGLVIGDPDVSAITRLARRPVVSGFHEALRHGIAVNPRHTRTIFNSQNTAYVRELAPAMLLCPQFRRFDDIVCSLVAQRVMADTGHHVLFGPPTCLHERNAHDLQRDLDDESWGQANILKVQEKLWRHDVPKSTVLTTVQWCYDRLEDFMPGVHELAKAWIEDCERAMA